MHDGDRLMHDGDRLMHDSDRLMHDGDRLMHDGDRKQKFKTTRTDGTISYSAMSNLGWVRSIYTVYCYLSLSSKSKYLYIESFV